MSETNEILLRQKKAWKDLRMHAGLSPIQRREFAMVLAKNAAEDFKLSLHEMVSFFEAAD